MQHTKLATILAGGPAHIAETAPRLARREVQLDATGVDTLSAADLAGLLASIPADWDFVELGEVIDPATLLPGLAAQLTAWLNQRHGRAQAPDSSHKAAEPQSRDQQGCRLQITELITHHSSLVTRPPRFTDDDYRTLDRRYIRAAAR